MSATVEVPAADRLPERDESYLNEKGYDWRLVREVDGLWLVIIGFGVDDAVYARDAPALAPEPPDQKLPDDIARWERSLDDNAVILMIKIPPQYPQSKLDMFYLWPHVRLVRGGHPDRASHFEPHLGRNTQRFSRHLQRWRPGVDGVPMYLALIHGILNPRR